jgi:hypothetical protein
MLADLFGLCGEGIEENGDAILYTCMSNSSMDVDVSRKNKRHLTCIPEDAMACSAVQSW